MFCRRRKVGSSENDDCRSDICIFSNIIDAVFDTLGLGLRRHVAFSVILQLPSDLLPFPAPHLSLPWSIRIVGQHSYSHFCPCCFSGYP